MPDADLDVSSHTPRRQARILAMQFLCDSEIHPEQRTQRLFDWLADLMLLPPVQRFAVELVENYWKLQAQVDQRIARACTNWEFSRVSPVERNIMRVAVVEMLDGDVPPKVAMDEAIEIGREYGGEESPRFINGVLNEVYREVAEGMGESSGSPESTPRPAGEE